MPARARVRGLPEHVTYSPNVQIPLSTACSDACSYCVFRSTNPGSRSMTPSEVLRRLDLGRRHGCSEALFIHGQDPDSAQDVRDDLSRWGFVTMADFLEWGCRASLQYGVLPHSNVGIVEKRTLSRLGGVNASMGLMLECSAKLPAHRRSPSKAPMHRIRFIEAAGELRIPFTTGLLVGIGESSDDRIRGLRVIADLHSLYHHIQEVIIQPLILPSQFAVAPPLKSVMIKTVAQASRILPREVAIQIPANLVEPAFLIELLAEGATDLGGMSSITKDEVNPSSQWPNPATLSRYLEDHGVLLKSRLPLYPGFISREWCSEEVLEAIEICLEKVSH